MLSISLKDRVGHLSLFFLPIYHPIVALYCHSLINLLLISILLKHRIAFVICSFGTS